MSAADATTLAMDLLDSWNKRDLGRFRSLLADDVTWYDPGMAAPPARSADAALAFAKTVLAAFPDFMYTIREPMCASKDGTRCVFPWRITATHSGWMRPPGFAPTGQRVEIEGVDVLDSRSGKIVRIETYFDALPAAEQLLRLRLRPAPGSMRERIVVGVQSLRAGWLRRTSRTVTTSAV